MNKQNLQVRKCKECNSSMYIIVQDKHKEIHPFEDRLNTFVCESCNHEIDIVTNMSTFRNFITGIIISFLLVYFLLMGLFDFIMYSFSESFLSALLGIALIVGILFFVTGCYIVLRNGLNQVRIKKSYPVIDNKEYSKQNNKQICLALILGALPILFSVGIGYIDFNFYEINKTMAFIFMPIVFSPIIFAKKLNSSVLNVFYGTTFWAILGFVGFYLFG